MGRTVLRRHNLRQQKNLRFQASSRPIRKSLSTATKLKKARRKKCLVKSRDLLPEIESTKEFKPVPRKLGGRIYELCDEYSVKWAEWIQKSTDWKTVLILGRGVANEKLKQKLTNEVKWGFPELKLEFIESGPSHVNHLSYPRVHVKDGPKNGHRSTCQLILSSKKGETESFYAATTAHTILTDEMWERVDEHPEEGRRAAEEHVAGRKFMLKMRLRSENPEAFDLDEKAMFAFQEWHTPSSTRANESYRSYRNDIAIFRSQSTSDEVLQAFRTSGYTSSNFPFQGLLDKIPNLCETPFYIHGHECRFTGGLHGRENDHISFYPVDEWGKKKEIQFNIGDSGSILYIMDKDVKKPIGMLVARHKKHDFGNYRAILLQPSLRELEDIYSDRLTKLVVVNIKRKGLKKSIES